MKIFFRIFLLTLFLCSVAGSDEGFVSKVFKNLKKTTDFFAQGISFEQVIEKGTDLKNNLFSKKDETFQETSGHPDDTKISANFQNLSPHRVSLWWDNDEDLKRVINVIPPGESGRISTFVGHSFVFTREGTRDTLGNTITIKEGQVDYILPKDAKEDTNPCKDRYRKRCPEWATAGECQKNPGWMIVNCPSACEACDLLDPAKRCDPSFLNVSAESIWKPGDLNLMFERILAENKDEFDIEVLGKPPSQPWVLRFNKFMSDKEVESLLKWGQKLGYERSTDTGKPNDRGEVTKVFSTGRTSSNTWCTGNCETDENVKNISERIVRLTKVPYEHYEQFQLLQYELGQQYKPHNDMSPLTHKRAGGVRILTFFLYLSDVEEGGETEFPKLGIKVTPKKGSAILWPSVLDSDPMAQDSRTLHAALPVIKGEKYAANHWIHSHNFKKANKWGCTGAFD